MAKRSMPTVCLLGMPAAPQGDRFHQGQYLSERDSERLHEEKHKALRLPGDAPAPTPQDPWPSRPTSTVPNAADWDK